MKTDFANCIEKGDQEGAGTAEDFRMSTTSFQPTLDKL